MKFKDIKTLILKTLVYLSAAITVGVFFIIVGYVVKRGYSTLNWDFIISTPSYLKAKDGILPNILNTFYIVILTLIITLPIGIGAAIYLNEYAKSRRFVSLIEFAINILSGVPSIVFGLVGMLIFVQFFSLKTSLIAGALTMSMLILPGIVRTTEESLKQVPSSYRDGALALGAGTFYTTRTVVIPSALNGIFAGVVLSIGRITGESAALLFTAGVANKLLGLLDIFLSESAGSTLTVALYIYAKERGDFDIAFALAIILLVLTFIINILAGFIIKRGKRI